jgi:hypothetical protein
MREVELNLEISARRRCGRLGEERASAVLYALELEPSYSSEVIVMARRSCGSAAIQDRREPFLLCDLSTPGEYQLQLDVVRELVAWFADKRAGKLIAPMKAL